MAKLTSQWTISSLGGFACVRPPARWSPNAVHGRWRRHGRRRPEGLTPSAYRCDVRRYAVEFSPTDGCRLAVGVGDQARPSRAEPSRAEPSRAEPSRAEPPPPTRGMQRAPTRGMQRAPTRGMQRAPTRGMQRVGAPARRLAMRDACGAPTRPLDRILFALVRRERTVGCRRSGFGTRRMRTMRSRHCSSGEGCTPRLAAVALPSTEPCRMQNHLERPQQCALADGL